MARLDFSDGVWDESKESFKRDPSPPRQPSAPRPQLPAAVQSRNTNGAPSGLNDAVIRDILAATCAMPSWKAYRVKGRAGQVQQKKIRRGTSRLLGHRTTLAVVDLRGWCVRSLPYTTADLTASVVQYVENEAKNHPLRHF